MRQTNRRADGVGLPGEPLERSATGTCRKPRGSTARGFGEASGNPTGFTLVIPFSLGKGGRQLVDLLRENALDFNSCSALGIPYLRATRLQSLTTEVTSSIIVLARS